jgi:hypothetical protein
MQIITSPEIDYKLDLILILILGMISPLLIGLCLIAY